MDLLKHDEKYMLLTKVDALNEGNNLNCIKQF